MRLFLLTDDLLFCSRLQAELGAAGHACTVGAAAPPADAELILADLTHDHERRLRLLSELAQRPPVLAYYSHVETGVRAAAESAGVERVVPRSRMAREAVALVAATAR
ncbi:MAG: hypothetical protein NVSMB51_09580 [Solirubrobacteraceae bacterium]